ncbi:MAG: M48 family metalloprotease [Steroidobacteraceae bacterium]
MIQKFVLMLLTAVAVAGCATNPATGKQNVVLSSMKSERESARRAYEEIIKFYGAYEDQAVQDYINEIGQRVARQSDLPDEEWKFVVLDDESVNAFTTGGGYVYLHRGLLTHLNSEAEIASVIGHEIAHVTLRHPARRQSRGMLASILSVGAAIATGSQAVAQMANIGAAAWVQGYGRESEAEADRYGLKYAAKAGYQPEAMARTFEMFKAQERFERDRAREEGREPQIYHGVFSSHPAPDSRAFEAAKGAAAFQGGTPEGGWVENHDRYLRMLDGMPYGSSRAQGIVRENRFYHAGMGITLAFPRGWTVENMRDRLLAYTVNKDSVMQLTSEVRPENKAPREFLLEKLKGASLAGGEAISSNGMDGYTLLARTGSPLDNGQGPVRWTVIYRDKSAFVFGGASKSANQGRPEADGLFVSVAQTLRSLKPSEFPLAEPYRLKIRAADGPQSIDQYASDVPVEKYKKEELQLINGVYPDSNLKPGQLFKTVE